MHVTAHPPRHMHNYVTHDYRAETPHYPVSVEIRVEIQNFVGSITMVKASVVVLGKAPATGAKLTVDIFEVTEVELPELADGELLIRVLYASVDPCV